MKFRDLGHMPWDECAELQTELVERVASGEEDNTLLFVEHDPVLTLGVNFHEENLLLSQAEYQERGISVERTNRGGDVTYHGPGQLVIYPIFRMELVDRDLHRWMRVLEETMIQTIAAFGIQGHRSSVNTGCWVNDCKIAAIGVKIRRWTSMHGVALNCNTDLEAFDLIVPCGVQDYGVTSMSYELGRIVTIDEVYPRAIEAFERVFSVNLYEEEFRSALPSRGEC